MKNLRPPFLLSKGQVPCGTQASVAALAFALALTMPLAAQMPDSPQAPAATPLSESKQEPPQKPRTHAQTHAEAHEQAVAKARALDPAQTPKARYVRQVEGEIGRLWRQYSSFRRDAAPGQLEITFYVTKKGRVESLVIHDQKQSNVALTEVTLRAVRDAEIPAMPADVYPELPEFDPERLRFDFKFMIEPPDPAEKPKSKTRTPAEDAKPKTAAAPPQMPTMSPQGESWQQWLAGQEPMKEYHSQIGDMLDAEWERYLAANRRTMPDGQVRMSFLLKPDGGVDEVLILDKAAPIRLKNAGLAVIRAIQFPPMAPKEAALLAGKAGVAPLRGVRMSCVFSVGQTASAELKKPAKARSK